MSTPWRAFLNPSGQQLDLGGLERLSMGGRRHQVVRIAGGEPLHQGAGFRMTRHDGAMAGLQGRKGRFLLVQAEAGLALAIVRAMAGVAMLGKDRADLAIKIDGRAGLESGQASPNDEQNAR